MDEALEQVVWLPGGGGPAAIGAIKSLRADPAFRGTLVTTDSNPMSAGFSLADAAFVMPPASSPAYLPRAISLVRTANLQVVLPSSGFDILPLSRHREQLERLGVMLAFSDYETIVLCNDKLRLFQALERDFQLAWFTGDPTEVRFPCVAKPVQGKGSRDVFLCRTREDLDRATAGRGTGEMVIQEYLPGTEYSVDVLSDMSGMALFAVPRIRIETRGGISSKGQVVRHQEIERMCLAMAERLRLKGPTCFQVRDDAAGRPRLMEINPRLGGGTVISTLAGANLPLLTLEMLCGKAVAPPAVQEVVVLRYFEDVIWPGPPPEPCVQERPSNPAQRDQG